MAGNRFNEGKRRWALLSWSAMGELVKVLEFGATKYAPFNWAKGLSWTETSESLMRHLTAWLQGEDRDSETGLSHMAHVMCNAMFLMHFILTGTGTDDRPEAFTKKKGDSIGAERGTSNDAVVTDRTDRIQEDVQPEALSGGGEFSDGGLAGYSGPRDPSVEDAAYGWLYQRRGESLEELLDRAQRISRGALLVAVGNKDCGSTGIIVPPELRVHDDQRTSPTIHVGDGCANAGVRSGGKPST